jgi:hypothetical protein
MVAGVKHLEHAHPGAVVDGGELVEPVARTGNALEELDVDLQAMARLGLFVPLPSLPVGAMFLIRGNGKPDLSDPQVNGRLETYERLTGTSVNRRNGSSVVSAFLRHSREAGILTQVRCCWKLRVPREGNRMMPAPEISRIGPCWATVKQVLPRNTVTRITAAVSIR